MFGCSLIYILGLTDHTRALLKDTDAHDSNQSIFVFLGSFYVYESSQGYILSVHVAPPEQPYMKKVASNAI